MRLLIALGMFVVTAAPLAAQQQPYVDELPGQGRPIDTAVTAARRTALMTHLGDAVVLIPAAHEREGEAYGDYPQDTDFRQHNNFFYVSQLESEDAWILLNARTGGGGDQILLLPPRNPQQERWTGVRVGPDSQAVRLTGFSTVLATTSLDSLIAAARNRHVPFYVEIDPTTREEEVINHLRADTANGLVVRNLRPSVDSMRVVKDADEIARLRRAARISAEAHADLMREAQPGMWEYEMEAIIEAGFRRRGADRVGYPSIVGSGINATTLHYDVNRRQSKDGDLVVVDAAAEYGEYTADVTRTFPINGHFTPRQRAIYDLVLATQQTAMDSTRPGMTLIKLNQIARVYMREHSGNLCPPGPGETADRTSCDRYMIHGLSHWIGMDVHDVGPYQIPLAPGMVFTIEPGIYIPSEALGVRIEDDILVTATGYENLSDAAPRAAADVERLMQSGRQRAAATRSGR
ncbi:MAG TPA: aminopeptidase P family protein [Gemmatimonadales bacterium]|jgi:Xaa-Pro aminopeptidase